ncbi:MAG TPA: hypothetical protein VGF33_09850 [Caulobacteraceae bacterium]
MEITTRDLWTVAHGMGFGALFMLAFSGAVAELYRMTAPGAFVPSPRARGLFKFYLAAMVAMAWAAVFTGAYIVYPWYRASPPAGANLADFPKALLVSSPHTSAWHSLGMEWKEHVAWLAPISMTMVAYVFLRYGPALAKLPEVRKVALIFTLVAFVATGVAGSFGVFLNKYAPVRGGAVIHILPGEKQ